MTAGGRPGPLRQAGPPASSRKDSVYLRIPGILSDEVYKLGAVNRSIIVLGEMESATRCICSGVEGMGPAEGEI